MKNMIIAFFIAAAAAFFAQPAWVCAEEAAGYEYTVINGEVTVIGFTGEPEYIGIPEFIEGCPVTEVRDNAFYNCTSLRSISLPDTIIKIGHHSFYGCYSLESIVLPAELEELGMGCFCGCTELKEVKLPDTLRVLPDSCFRVCTSLKDVILPGEVTAVEKFCFAGCTGLESINLGDSLQELGDRALFMCDSLESLYIPPSVERIGTEAAGYSSDGKSISETGVLILGAKDSAAQRYAGENGLSFRAAAETADVFAEAYDAEPVEAPKGAVYLGFLLFGALAVIALRLMSGEEGKRERVSRKRH